jgi:hypothetical protein
MSNFDEALKRAKAALLRETDDPYYIPDRLLHEFAKEIERAYLDGAQKAREDDVHELKSELAFGQDPETNMTPDTRSGHCRAIGNSIARISQLDPRPSNRAEKCLTIADKLAAEAASFLEIGHSTGDEDQPLEEALKAYRALRLL